MKIPPWMNWPAFVHRSRVLMIEDRKTTIAAIGSISSGVTMLAAHTKAHGFLGLFANLEHVFTALGLIIAGAGILTTAIESSKKADKAPGEPGASGSVEERKLALEKLEQEKIAREEVKKIEDSLK